MVVKTDSQVSKKTGDFDGPQARSGTASAVDLNPSHMKESEDKPDLRRSMSEFDQTKKPLLNSL